MAKGGDKSAELPIQFGAGQSSLEELSGAAPMLWNFLSDAGDALHQRPGLRPWSDFPGVIPNASPVIGMYAWLQYLIYVCEDRTIWAWYGPGDVRALSGAPASTRLDGALRPVFTYDPQRVVISGGGLIQKWEGVGLSARLGGNPPPATHIGYNTESFIVNIYDNSGRIQWSAPGTGNHEVWTTVGVDPVGGFARAEADPDPALALGVTANEVFVFGTKTMQVFLPDGDSGNFIAGSAIGVGCGARHSIIEVDGAYAWLDERQRFVHSGGREFDAISSPVMARAISALEDVQDAWGFRTRIGSFDLLVWVFGTEERTVVYDLGSKKWSEWRGWTGVEWSGWIGTSYYYWAEHNIHLVGLPTGEIVEMTFEAFMDMALPIKCISRTGFRDGGTGNRKLCRRVQLQLQRGATLPGNTAPYVELRYRDDLGGFTTAAAASLGVADYAPTVARWALGMYRERQYELTFENNAEFVLSQARETVELGDS